MNVFQSEMDQIQPIVRQHGQGASVYMWYQGEADIDAPKRLVYKDRLKIMARDLRKEMKDINALADVYEKILLRKPKELGLLRELCVFYLKLKNPLKAIRKIEKYKLEILKVWKRSQNSALTGNSSSRRG